MPRDKRISLSLLSHDEPLEVVRYEHRRVVHDSTLDFTILFLVDILHKTQDVLLPEWTESFMRLKVNVVLQTCFKFPLKLKKMYYYWRNKSQPWFTSTETCPGHHQTWKSTGSVQIPVSSMLLHFLLSQLGFQFQPGPCL